MISSLKESSSINISKSRCFGLFLQYVCLRICFEGVCGGGGVGECMCLN